MRRLFQRQLAGEGGLRLGLLPASIALVQNTLHCLLLVEIGSQLKGLCAKICTADMGRKQILGVGALTANLGVEIHAAHAPSAATDLSKAWLLVLTNSLVLGQPNTQFAKIPKEERSTGTNRSRHSPIHRDLSHRWRKCPSSLRSMYLAVP